MSLQMPESSMTTREKLIAQLCTLSYADFPAYECRRLTEYLQDVLATIMFIKKTRHIRYYEPGQTPEQRTRTNVR